MAKEQASEVSPWLAPNHNSETFIHPDVKQAQEQANESDSGERASVSEYLIIASTVGIFGIISVIGFFMYRKYKTLKNQDANPQVDEDVVEF